jgi:hypothetical protein
MARIRVEAAQGQMAAVLSDVPAFPGERFVLGFPEAIGDAARAVWYGDIKPQWRQTDDGAWESTGEMPGELRYRLLITPYEDHVDAVTTLTNCSDRVWRQGMAFNCFNCGSSVLRDNECLRHWVRVKGEFRRLVELPRVFSERPTVQLYNVEGAPPGAEIPFVPNFKATPADVIAEGWMAIVAPDGRRLAATVSKPALFLFQNMEYSCIHSAPSFGTLRPGQTAKALTRLYFVRSSLRAWYERMKGEMDI